jgi:hypothetical protein
LSYCKCFLFYLFGESKICNFTYMIMQQYIGQLKISMHCINFMKSFKSIKNLFQKINSFNLRYFSLFFAILLKISTIAELSNYEYTITWWKRVNKFDYILTFYILKYLYLWFNELFELRNLFHLFFAHGFNS